MAQFEAQWAELIAAAQAEGEINVIVGGSSGRLMSERWQETFGDQFGIKVNTFTGRSADHWERISAERNAGIYAVDAWVTSGRFPSQTLVPAGVLQEITPLLIHPEAFNLSAWFGERFWWADAEEQYAITWWGNGGLGSIAYNTEKLTPSMVDQLRSWTDLYKPEFHGEIIVRDQTHDTFSCQYLEYGEEWFRNIWIDQDPILQANDRQGADWLSRGVGSVGLGVGGEDLEILKEGGLPVEIELPHPLDACNNMSSASGNLVVFDRASNQKAAELFLNWIMTAEGQYQQQESAGGNSLREDIAKDNVNQENVRLDGIEYVFECCDPALKEVTDDAIQLRYQIGVEAGLWQ